MPAYSQELQDVYLGWCLASRQETCLQEIWPSSLRHQVPRFFQIVITCWIWMWFPPHGVHRYFSPSLCPTWVSRIYPLSCLLRQVSQDDDQSHQNRTATALPLPFAPVLPHLVLAASFHINLDIPVTVSYSCRDIWKEDAGMKGKRHFASVRDCLTKNKRKKTLLTSDQFHSLVASALHFPEFCSQSCCSFNSGQNNRPVTCTYLTPCTHKTDTIDMHLLVWIQSGMKAGNITWIEVAKPLFHERMKSAKWNKNWQGPVLPHTLSMQFVQSDFISPLISGPLPV